MIMMTLKGKGSRSVLRRELLLGISSGGGGEMALGTELPDFICTESYNWA